MALQQYPLTSCCHAALVNYFGLLACRREVMQAAFAEAAGLRWGQPAVDSLRLKLRARQADLQLSVAAADAVVKETIR